MTTTIAKLATNVGVSEEEITEVVKGMIVSAKGQHGASASNAELTVVAGICGTYGLNPLVREAHAFVSGGKLQVIIGVDGWVKIMNRHPDFNGVEFVDNLDGKDLVSITTKIHIKGRDFPICVTEYMDECYQSKSPAWQKFSKRMLRNKSLGQCIRIAFGISEIIDNDEADRIRSAPTPKDVTPQPSIDFTAIELAMAECGDLDILRDVCGDLREEMQANGTWDSNKSDIIALNIKHKDRINGYGDIDVTSDVVADGDAIEGEVVDVVGDTEITEPDIGFGEDDTDEFGE